MLRAQKEGGDTIVEVLFAVSIFSLVVVGALALVNNAAMTAQRSLETTLVRQQIDAQAETLRLMHNAYTAEHQRGKTYGANDTSLPAKWSRLASAASTETPSAFGQCVPPNGSFFMNSSEVSKVNVTGGTMTRDPDTYAKVVNGQSEGLWIEAVRSIGTDTGTRAGYIDFHIRACWNSVGMNTPMTLGTIVRLYEVRA